MKRKILNSCLLLFVILISSCSKKTEISNIDSQINKTVVAQVLAAKNGDELKLMYKTLNPSEKYFAWETKYDKLISATNLTSEQTAFVRKLKSNLSKEIFEKGNNAVKDKLQTLEPIFKKEAIELFGISGAYELMANLNPESNLQQYPPGQGDCDCSKKSDWCPSGHACLRVGCVIVEDDCGWWWSYDCTGDCWIDV